MDLPRATFLRHMSTCEGDESLCADASMNSTCHTVTATVDEGLAWGCQCLKSAGFDAWRLEAELLLAQALDCSRAHVYVALHDTIPPDVLQTYMNLLHRRLFHEPIAYILGRKEFMSLDFKVGPGALIPRPETETLVEEALRKLRDRMTGRGETIVFDIGTGCGCIAISLAKYAPGCRIFASDVSAEALEVACTNAEVHGVTDQVTFCLGDLYEPFRGMGLEGRADLVVSNPPYLSDEEYLNAGPDIRHFEPEVALRAGQEGLELSKRIILGAVPFLTPSGYLLLETGGKPEKLREQLLAVGYEEPTVACDLGGTARVLAARQRDEG